MIRTIRLLTATGLFSFATPTFAADHDALAAWLTQTVESHGMAGLTAVIVKDGQVVFNQSFGVIDTSTTTSVTTQHQFHMASVSKPLVAVAIMQLVESGKINLAAPITDYLPYFTMSDDRLPGVTIEKILAHTSGMPDVEDYEWMDPQVDDKALERWVRAQAGKSLLFTPGESRQYSNIGYEILGDVIAKVSGDSFEQYMKKNIFKPLGMKKSSFLRSEIPGSQKVRGHEGATYSHPMNHYPYNRRHAPSSTFHTNGDEFAMLLRTFSSPTRFAKSGLLQPDTINQLWSVQYTMTEHSKMTLGWFWENSSTGPLLRHGGGDDGFRSEMAVYEKKDVAFGFMMNRSDGPVAEIREALRKAAVAAPLPETPRTVALIALALYEVGGTAPVISLFGEKQASSRQDAYSIYTFSVDLLRRGKLDDALDLAKGMVSHSDHPLLQHHLAETLWANGQLEGALKAVKRTLELQDGYGPSLKLLGEIERNQQKTQ